MKRESEKKRRWEIPARERRAILLFLPLAGLSIWLAAEAVKPRFEDSALILGDTLAAPVAGEGGFAENSAASELFPFDPNTATYEEFRSLGIDRKTAAGIVKYRTAGKVFAIPEDFATCYGISDSAYAVLKPYIAIGEEHRMPRKTTRLAARSDANGITDTAGAREEFENNSAGRAAVSRPAAPFDPNALDARGFEALGFTPKQAQAIINFREACGGFRTAEDFGKSYVVSDEAYARLRERIVIAPSTSAAASGMPEPHVPGTLPQEANGRITEMEYLLELNAADSGALVKVRGIGAKTASAITSYRERLGGFHRAEQILETGIITERNWELIREQIRTDSCAIRKIDINFALPNAIAQHPYISPRTMRKLMRNRQLKGGWSTIEDMIEDNTLTKEEAAKLAPYLHFGAEPLR